MKPVVRHAMQLGYMGDLSARLEALDGWLRQRWGHRLPRGFQQGVMPWVFVVACGLLIFMLVFSWLFYRVYPILPTLCFAGVMAALLIAVNYGLKFEIAIELLIGFSVVILIYIAYLSGGVFTPRLAWMVLLPMVPFFFSGFWSGLRWWCLVVLSLLVIGWISWLGDPNVTNRLGSEHLKASFVTYSIITVLMILLPYAFHHHNRKTIEKQDAHHHELMDKKQSLIKTLALRDRFIGDVSHELRTPMNAILGFNELLLVRVRHNPEALKILNHTKNSAEHLMTVINDVLDYSQLQSGTLTIKISLCDLHQIIQKAFDVLAPKAALQPLDYRYELSPLLPKWVETDQHRLVQVLVNLLGNALKFTKEGQVLLQVIDVEGGVQFSVRDTGIGIPHHQQSQIFKRFSQADGNIHQRYGGNGLGLAISRRLVELMGGEMGFESREGFGSHFWFGLPLVAQPAPTTMDSPQETPNLQTTHIPWCFLVVDDHPVNRLLVKKVLQATWPQAQIKEAVDGQEALDSLSIHPIDAIFMDMRMPRLNGIEATERIRHNWPHPFNQVIIIGLTANINEDDLLKFHQAGINDLMLKPFDWKKLCHLVDSLLIQQMKTSSSNNPILSSIQ